jgi:hypothetical protein
MKRGVLVVAMAVGIVLATFLFLAWWSDGPERPFSMSAGVPKELHIDGNIQITMNYRKWTHDVGSRIVDEIVTEALPGFRRVSGEFNDRRLHMAVWFFGEGDIDTKAEEVRAGLKKIERKLPKGTGRPKVTVVRGNAEKDGGAE